MALFLAFLLKELPENTNWHIFVSVALSGDIHLDIQTAK